MAKKIEKVEVNYVVAAVVKERSYTSEAGLVQGMENRFLVYLN